MPVADAVAQTLRRLRNSEAILKAREQAVERWEERIAAPGRDMVDSNCTKIISASAQSATAEPCTGQHFRLQVGDRVRLVGLRAVRYNGLEGIVRMQSCNDNRLTVEIVGGGHDGRGGVNAGFCGRFHPANLRKFIPGPAWAAQVAGQRSVLWFKRLRRSCWFEPANPPVSASRWRSVDALRIIG